MSNSYSKIAHSYSKAFLEVNNDIKFLQSSIKQLKSIYNAFNSGSKMGEYLLNKWTSIKKKVSLWQQISNCISINKDVSHLIDVLITNNRLNILHDVIYYIEKYLNEKDGVMKIIVKSSCDIDEKMKDSLMSDCENIFKTKVIPEFKTDEAILGGLIISNEMYIVDLSLQRKIKTLKKAFNIS